jgi:hypothetical protein
MGKKGILENALIKLIESLQKKQAEKQWDDNFTLH